MVAETERRRSTIVRVITRYIAGTSVAMSFIADSWKALLSIAIPVMCVLKPGFSSSTRAASSRAKATDLAVSSVSFLGS